MEDAITVSALKKYFGDFPAVDNIGFEVRKGEFFGFLGPNGAGKTTTQRMLTGIIRATAGTINIMGYDLMEDPFKAKMLMGVVPEMANPYIDFSAWDNLMLMGQLYGLDKKKRKTRAEALLGLLGLLDRKDLKTKTFSKGMKQKLILAMALIHEPSLIFLDEPTSGLDVQSTRLIRNLVAELNRNGTTVFLTTHNIEEANLMCDRVAIINHGRIAAIDRPAALRAIISSSQSVEVAFDRPANNIESLKNSNKVNDVRKEGDRYKLYTDHPGEAASLLLEFAKAENLKILSVNTLGPGLEDVFVHLTCGEGGQNA